MDFRLAPEQDQFRDAVRRFAEKHLAAGAHERAHASGYPWDVAGLMATQGLLGITIAEADGGQGGTLMDAVIAIDAVAAACPRSADVVQAGNFGPIRVLAEYGSPAQKQKFLGKLLSGESVAARRSTVTFCARRPRSSPSCEIPTPSAASEAAPAVPTR